MTKVDLRKESRTRLRGISAEELARKSARICRRISEHEAWHAAKNVCLFSPQAHEPDLGCLWNSQAGHVLYFPRVNGAELDILRVDDPGELHIGRWQLREPLHTAEKLLDPVALDLILVPGAAFTENGRRLGRGGGYYDRLLAFPGLRARILGICFAEQIFENLPTEPHDRFVEEVIRA